MANEEKAIDFLYIVDCDRRLRGGAFHHLVHCPWAISRWLRDEADGNAVVRV